VQAVKARPVHLVDKIVLCCIRLRGFAAAALQLPAAKFSVCLTACQRTVYSIGACCTLLYTGLTLVVGSVGSGKSTLLAGLLEHLGSGDVTITSST
jgi:Tfp pilus assembly pilus retraction ATPase PilT